MQQKQTKLVRIQKFVQDIKEQPQCKGTKKVQCQSHRIRHPETQTTIMSGLIPLQEDPKFDAMMDNIKRILDKRKKQPEVSKAEQLKSMLTTNQVKQIYGSRRHMIEVRFKEFYNSRIVSPHQFVEVINTPKDEGKTSRLFQYQRRIGLVKKKDLLEEKIQEIGQRHRTKQ